MGTQSTWGPVYTAGGAAAEDGLLHGPGSPPSSLAAPQRLPQRRHFGAREPICLSQALVALCVCVCVCVCVVQLSMWFFLCCFCCSLVFFVWLAGFIFHWSFPSSIILCLTYTTSITCFLLAINPLFFPSALIVGAHLIALSLPNLPSYHSSALCLAPFSPFQ